MGIFAGDHNRDTTPTSDKYWYHTNFQDLGDRDNLGNNLIQYFDQRFALLDASTKSDINDIMKSQGDWGQMAWTDPTMYENNQQMVAAIEAAVMRHLSGALVGDIVGEQIAGVFDDEFFQGIAAEGEGAFDTFARFSMVVQNTDDFVEQFTRQMEEFDESAIGAYNNLLTVTQVMASIDAQLMAINAIPFLTDLDGIDATFDALILTLKQANATLDEVNRAEMARNQLLGARVTGLTGPNLAQALTGGGDIDSILQKSITEALAAGAAKSISEKYFAPLNRTVGALMGVTGNDMNAVLSLLENYDLSGAREDIADFQAQIESLFGDLTDTVSETLENGIDDARAALDAAINKEWELANARLGAANQIDDLINNLMGSDYAPVQSLEFFQRRYQQLLDEAQGADTAEEITRAVDNLTSFVPTYLDFAKAYGGTDYNMLFQQITGDLRTIEDSQRTEAERQIDELERINSILGVMAEDVLDINVALQRYLAAVKDAETSTAIGSGGTGIDTGTDTTGGTDSVYDPVKALYATIGRTGFGDEVWQIDQSGYDYWTRQAQFMSFPELSESFYGAVEGYMAANPDDPLTDYMREQGFSQGAVISGPSSGYQMPGAEFHGAEMIVPLNGSPIPVVVQNDTSESLVAAIREALTGSGGGTINLTVNAHIGQQEINGLIREAIKTDPEVQQQVRRVG
jgi:hypothetical protein